jgi:hypothetical protein
LKIRLPKRKKKKKRGPLKADPPPWDVPLDQTKMPIHRVGDLSSW